MLSSGKITLIFLLYNAQETVENLVAAALAQRHPSCPCQSDWLEVVFMDDCSRDSTLAILDRTLKKAGRPPHFRVVANGENLGLAATLNKAFGLIETPYGLTCHLDVLFGRDDYVAQMLALMEAHPEAGAITGQPRVPARARLSTAEKFNIIANLMDIFPQEAADPLVPVGFAEGRCDVFRVEALRKAGFWDTTLHASGEDQILAARMRAHGYEVYQAPGLPYCLSVSGEQDSLVKLLKHTHLFGRTQPYIMLTNRRLGAGMKAHAAGDNRRSRLLLRATHVMGTATYANLLFGACAGWPVWSWCLPVLAVIAMKGVLLSRHVRALGLGPGEMLLFVAFVPLQDLCYTFGLAQGVWHTLWRSGERPIR
jgi:GT2 family glycosyltransferase